MIYTMAYREYKHILALLLTNFASARLLLLHVTARICLHIFIVASHVTGCTYIFFPRTRPRLITITKKLDKEEKAGPLR